MSKPKKANKPAKIPQPIKIKKEKLEEDRALHSMAHFVDDRVELVKQIFGSLKTKTITNLAPEYLKEKDMENIQELCLNELLCLSKKRLAAIINATKCPSDTESSEDSDVEAKDEHISLEEISSGSELENGEKSTRKTGIHPRTKKNPKNANPADNKQGNDGQMSVLELLELQARARAIRSQLALEPVTKIEVDLDDDTSSTTKEQKTNRKRKKTTNNGTEKPASSSSSLSSSAQQPTDQSPPIIEASGENAEKLPTAVNSQKIKLKRNFRKQNQYVLDAESSEQEQPEPVKLKKEKGCRSPSPDVIPIEPEPETLCISDSASDSEEVVPTQPREQAPAPEKMEEAEDGEIIEAKVLDIMEISAVQSDIVAVAGNAAMCESENAQETSDNSIENHKVTILECEILSNFTGIVEDKPADWQEERELKENALSHVHEHEHEIDADQNDDVISIEGGDLETEMSEHLDEDTSSKCKRDFNTERSKNDKKESNDVISLDSSDNEDESTQPANNESWQVRYLKSSKVSKVLAVSRLGKRVRDKLKTSKHSKRETPHENNKEEEPENFTSQHEEGSVEQYRELLELSHRKT